MHKLLQKKFKIELLFTPLLCFFQVIDIWEKLLASGFTRPPNGGSVTMTTLAPPSSRRKPWKNVTTSCTKAYHDFSDCTSGTTFDVKGVFFLYLIVKEVMVEHIIVAELILSKKLAVPKRAEKQRGWWLQNACNALNKYKCQHAFQNS